MTVDEMMVAGEALANGVAEWLEASQISDPIECLSVVTVAERLLREHKLPNPHLARNIVATAHATFEAVTTEQTDN